ncbi:MAG TPA: protein-disulfide isomerase [Geobacter sp.]|nr:protein-disulfide isomerase [Geobacter sp.]
MRDLKILFRTPLVLALLMLFAPGVHAQDSLDLDKAVKIGNGKTMVIEFTDPDCPYCRKAEAYFQGKAAQVTRYVFFVPLPSHPDSKAKVQYILSARDKVRAYLEVITGGFDKSKLAQITPEGVRLQKEHQEIAKANKMDATPTFMIYGRIIEGFDLKKLEPLLKP